MTAALKLYEVADALVLIGEQLEENGGELTPEIEEQLAVLDGAFEQKVERILLYAQNYRAAADAAVKEAERLASLGRSRTAIADRLRGYVKAQMDIAGRTKIETDRIVARIQKNGRPSIHCLVPIDTLPEGFVRVRREFNAEVAYELWKAKAPLPDGITVEHGSHLRVS